MKMEMEIEALDDNTIVDHHMNNMNDKNKKITINVGNKLYDTTLPTLLRYKDSMLYRMVNILIILFIILFLYLSLI